MDMGAKAMFLALSKTAKRDNRACCASLDKLTAYLLVSHSLPYALYRLRYLSPSASARHPRHCLLVPLWRTSGGRALTVTFLWAWWTRCIADGCYTAWIQRGTFWCTLVGGFGSIMRCSWVRVWRGQHGIPTCTPMRWPPRFVAAYL